MQCIEWAVSDRIWYLALSVHELSPEFPVGIASAIPVDRICLALEAVYLVENVPQIRVARVRTRGTHGKAESESAPALSAFADRIHPPPMN